MKTFYLVMALMMLYPLRENVCMHKRYHESKHFANVIFLLKLIPEKRAFNVLIDLRRLQIDNYVTYLKSEW